MANIKDINLLKNHRELLKFWDFTRNPPMDNISIHSSMQYYFLCSENHSYKRSLPSQKKTNVCPVCSGRQALAGYNDLKTLLPALAAQWHYEKNFPLLPENFRPGAKKKVAWQCTSGHEYEREIYLEKRFAGQCPICSGQRVLGGYNDLKTCYPLLEQFWASENPPMENFLPQSAFRATWTCPQNHRYERRIYHQTSGTLALCPQCPKPIPKEKSLAARFPTLIQFWHEEKNALPPNQYYAYSRKEVWWTCGTHTFKETIKIMSETLGICKLCKHEQDSTQEAALARYISHRWPQLTLVRNYKFQGKYEWDIYIPNLQIAIEFNGELWHSNEYITDRNFASAKEYHSFKKLAARKKKVSLAFVWSHDWRSHRSEIYEALKVLIEQKELVEILTRLESKKDANLPCIH